ncbi:MAG: hypothetical protein HYW49_12700 [Deltaproteobacteria bacterium]|nr:hypothetical protein [Deltaproteobacteria bacterium]
MKIGSRGLCRRRIKELAVLAGLLFVIAPTLTSHAEFFVTSVIRDVPMKQGEAQYKDFYINAGTNNGLQKGVFLDALRKMAVFDNINSKLAGNTPVKIARLKVIHVDKSVCVARLVKFYEKETTPLAGFDNVMIGDLIEVSEKQ